MKVIESVLGEVRIRDGISDETLGYVLVKNHNIGRFYLLPKINKRLHNLQGRPVIANSGFFTENISCFTSFYIKPLSRKIK